LTLPVSIPVSIIVPVYNEARTIERLLHDLCALHPSEVIVVDGGSEDGTAQRVGSWARLLRAPLGRASQMNAGARSASGEVLWFVHADVRVSERSLDAICQALADASVAGGNFDVVYDGDDAAARAFTRINRLRCRFGIFYGDSGIFCRRTVFAKMRGFREWPILEDYEFARRLRKLGKVAFLSEPIHPSPRRWQSAGLLATMWAWFWIQALYLAGVSPYWLARLYKHVR
jgi:rSAM/selenodomain-associated transferase 2